MAALRLLFVLLVILAVFAMTGWWILYKFHDCRRVGHTLIYCIADQVFG